VSAVRRWIASLLGVDGGFSEEEAAQIVVELREEDRLYFSEIAARLPRSREWVEETYKEYGNDTGLSSKFQKRPLMVDGDVHARFERARENTKNEHIPAMEQSDFLSSLLDTKEAAEQGYYENVQ